VVTAVHSGKQVAGPQCPDRTTRSPAARAPAASANVDRRRQLLRSAEHGHEPDQGGAKDGDFCLGRAASRFGGSTPGSSWALTPHAALAAGDDIGEGDLLAPLASGWSALRRSRSLILARDELGAGRLEQPPAMRPSAAS